MAAKKQSVVKVVKKLHELTLEERRKYDWMVKSVIVDGLEGQALEDYYLRLI